MPSHNRTERTIRALCKQISNLTDNTIRFRWSEREYLAGFGAITSAPEFADLPRWARERIGGYREGLFHAIDIRLVRAYQIGGEWLPLTSIEYSKLSIVAIRANTTGCATVWADSPDRLWGEIVAPEPEIGA